ncbi:MAG: hypothetical protein A2286_06105 [Gammaproteobacteria bacterium RIFOXYA12_FULL_61_12]|nr:MAG: hypothetical protein A2514_16000 [Gammaproteobacteria bacterium RIFOXYD12_FULL_61_37]OGT94587.1 MAG: hypothetical protein A2286_06105 [Gammaproteobacteria bacterium RIFOXYA12_FULL_61_12]
MDHLVEYERLIERLAAERTKQRVPNGLPEHAAVLLKTMFTYANSEIRVYSGDLSEIVFGNPPLLEAVSSFISRANSKLRILLQNAKDDAWLDSHPLTVRMRKLAQSGVIHGSFDIRNASGSYADADAHHFTVMDQDGYRFELEHEHTKAIANFNEPKVARNLIKAFDEAFEIAGEGKRLYSF